MPLALSGLAARLLKYSMPAYMAAAKAAIAQAQQPNAKPMLMYFAHQEVHIPLMPPIDPSIDAVCANVTVTENRNRLCRMAVELDRNVGTFVEELKAARMWDDTLLWVTTDNGGMAAFQPAWPASASSNYPLRAGKTTLFEGGVKGVGFVQGGRNVLPHAARGTAYGGLMHAVDILPTLAGAAGLAPSAANLDGVDLWAEISGAASADAPGGTGASAGHRGHADMPLNILPVCEDCDVKHLKLPRYSAIIEGETNWKLIDGHVGVYDGWVT
jgi:arylsulfatase A-like enzyme